MSTPESAFTSTPGAGTARGGRASTAMLKLQADERLVAHVRRGNEAAFEVLVARYQVRLLAFCRHMLGASARRDAEDVLQEVFASAYRAMLGDTRPINVRPWLYRIARNRCLNHLRRDPMPSIEGMELTVVDERIGTAETVHQRAEVRQLLADIQALPETQRTAILLREIDDLSYEQIALAMDNTVAAVKSLLVRARVGLAEAAESRRLSCDEVRFELGQHAEGLVDKLTPPTRRHLKECKSCSAFQQDLKDTNKALAMLAPAFGLVLLVKTILAPIGGSHAGGAAAGGAAGGAAAAGGGGLISIGGVLSAKTMTGIAAAVAVTGAAVEVKHVTAPSRPTITERQQARATPPPGVTSSATTTPSGGVAPAAVVGSTPTAKASRSEDEPKETTPATTPEAERGETTPITTPAGAEFPDVNTATSAATTPTTTPTIEDRTGVAELPDIEDRTDEQQVRPPIRLPVPIPASMRPQPATTPAAPQPTPTPAPAPAPQPAPTPAPQPPAPEPVSTPAPDVPAPTTTE